MLKTAIKRNFAKVTRVLPMADLSLKEHDPELHNIIMNE